MRYNPIGGLKASTTRPTPVTTAGEYVAAWGTSEGSTVVEDGGPREQRGDQRTTITSSTSETTIVTAGGAGVKLDIFRLIITNTSATACTVTIKEATAGTTKYIWSIPAGQPFGFAGNASSASKQTVANNNWTATCSASVASIEISAEYIKRI